jgi:hypothetical protein
MTAFAHLPCHPQLRCVHYMLPSMHGGLSHNCLLNKMTAVEQLTDERASGEAVQNTRIDINIVHS